LLLESLVFPFIFVWVGEKKAIKDAFSKKGIIKRKSLDTASRGKAVPRQKQ